MAAVKVEEQRGAKNAALIPSVRTLQDSKFGLSFIGGQPSLELYRGSSLLGSRLQWLKEIDIFIIKKVVTTSVYIGSQNPNPNRTPTP
ncbi:hypothetical protein BHE74_00054301 [Ensete ventricosum]|nr:hypothetical protein GW17_00006206 [Ensete ventricosum]RWW40295.1 hypothetical protein BHE74_00054301 [Ensete ventricosum]